GSKGDAREYAAVKVFTGGQGQGREEVLEDKRIMVG
ncbi:hypothetical protein A2U01_0041207, partial [Trifolium medium]|nr:hypothetical protein [Trifolium medium]